MIKKGQGVPFQPKFVITPAITKALMEVEACRQAIENLPISVEMLASLRETARLLSTHYSTQIEGNRLTAAQVQEVVRSDAHFPGRERDESEVKNYYLALDQVDTLSRQSGQLTERQLKIIHGLVMQGLRRPTKYRDGQNVIRDSGTGAIIYMPPEAKDVPALIGDLVNWVNEETVAQELPVPIIAALAHYQFATIHPYFDGNGRTARLLATFILHRHGYGLKGVYSLEEYYARNLPTYYESLAVSAHHNYYFGREEADITPFIAYFCEGMANAFVNVRDQAERAKSFGRVDQSPALRDLNSQQRSAITLFIRRKSITARDLASHLHLSTSWASKLCMRWVDEGFFVIHNPSKKSRSYQLSTEYEALMASQTG